MISLQKRKKILEKYSKLPSSQKCSYVAYLKQKYKKYFILDNYSEGANLYFFLHNLTLDDIRCPVCGNLVKFPYEGISRGFSKHCSSVCHANDTCTKKKRIKTNFSRYGTSCSLANKEVQRKSRTTMLERYGAPTTLESSFLSKKVKKTNLLKYGVENPFQSVEIQEKAKQATLEHYGTTSYVQSEDYKDRRGIITKKIQESRKKNGNFLSYPEELAYQFLCSLYSDVIRQYSSKSYPFACDFYIPSENLYIELQQSWVHGKHPYSSKSVSDRQLLTTLKEKAETSSYYRQVVRTWSELDPLKRNTAKKNKLNWVEFFSLEDFKSFFLKVIKEEQKYVYNNLSAKVKQYATKRNCNKVIQIINPLLHKLEQSRENFLFFFQGEVQHKAKIVQSIIKYHSNLCRRYFARKLTVREVTTKEAQLFLEANHLQGKCKVQYSLGLYKEDKLLAVMCFTRPNRDNHYTWELVRFCNRRNCTVVGGASKLLRVFIAKYCNVGDTVVSYADLRISNGNIYNVLGFKEVRRSQPNYWYYLPKDMKLLHKSLFRRIYLEKKLPLFNSQLSERENMENHGYLRFYNLGTITYLYEVK